MGVPVAMPDEFRVAVRITNVGHQDMEEGGKIGELRAFG